MPKKKVDIPRYMRKIIRAMRDTQPVPGSINHVHIYHDDDCDLLAGRGACNCNPEIVIPDLPGRN